MWALGWTHAGLVDNKPFPYKEDSTTFYLRYIQLTSTSSTLLWLNPIFDVVSNTEDATVAIGEPSRLGQ